ncbi:MAG: hypothetical protein ACOC7U_04820 [Spirochaetota bacterium]
MGVETVCEGGVGGSATVYIQLRNSFPGLGGTIYTEQDFVVAYRVPSGVALGPFSVERKQNQIYDPAVLDKKAIDALHMFLRHALIKKLDDYFFRKGLYKFAHIPRPLGSTANGGYLYEWVHGTEGFYSQYYDDEAGFEVPVKIDEWDTAARCFQTAGIYIFYDIADSDDGRYTKNIIVQEPSLSTYPEHITKLWKRIDFGYESLPVDLEKLTRFLEKNNAELNRYLKPERVKMMELIVDFLQRDLRIDKSSRFKLLTSLVNMFRLSTTEHMGVQGRSSVEELKTCRAKLLKPHEKQHLQEVSFTKKLQQSENSLLELEIRSGFRSIDGVIFTLQEIPVGRITYIQEADARIGFRIFLRHFIAKKLENAFMSEGKYSYAHIPRPLGSEGRSYYYDWAWGEPRCTHSLIRTSKQGDIHRGLSEWYEFVCFFEQAGIDFKSRLSLTASIHNPGKEVIKHIIVRQPYSEKEDIYISRLWKRVNFHENGTPIDFKKLEHYLVEKENYLRKYLAPGRYETMLVAARYLRGEKLLPSEYQELKQGVHNYRLSALRHLNHYGFGPPPRGFSDLQVSAGS